MVKDKVFIYKLKQKYINEWNYILKQNRFNGRVLRFKLFHVDDNGSEFLVHEFVESGEIKRDVTHKDELKSEQLYDVVRKIFLDTRLLNK